MMNKKSSVPSHLQTWLPQLALLSFAAWPLMTVASSYSYSVSATDSVQHTYSNSSNSEQLSAVSVSLSGSGGGFNLFRTTGSAITWNYDVGFNATNITFTASDGVSITKDWETTTGKFWGYPYIKNSVLDTLTTENAGAYAYLIYVGSGGTPGLASDERDLDLYRGGTGGAVSATIKSSTLTMTGGTATGSASSTTTPDASVLYFNSTGGDGGATASGYWMDAANGGKVTANISSTSINFSHNAGDSNAVWAGITATSIGGDGGMCCVYALGSNGNPDTSKPATLPTMAMTSTDYRGVNIDAGNVGSRVSEYGKNGSASAVSVTLDDVTITGTGSRLVGVSAASLGGARQVPFDLPGGGNWSEEYSGNATNKTGVWFVDFGGSGGSMRNAGSGGAVSVSLKSTQVDLSGGNDLVGVYAVSGSKPFYLLTNVLSFTDPTPAAGKVTLTVDADSSVTVSGGTTSGLSAGVFAAATGGYPSDPWGANNLPTWTFADYKSGATYTSSIYDMGSGGEVNVTLDGAVTVSGQYAVGAVALSAAGAATSGVSSQGASWGDPDGAAVTFTNSNSLSVTGQNVIGVVAASLGAGGLTHAVDGDYINGAGDSPVNRVIWGDYTKTTDFNYLNGREGVHQFDVSTGSADGASVTVTNAAGASISVGNTDGSSERAYGIVAQSVGSAGGVILGSGSWFHGSKGNAGGDGGAVQVTNSGAVKIFGESAVGILAQSIGGGGGAGGSAKGLFVALGGQGGGGGHGGDLTLNLLSGSSIITKGDFAVGFIGHTIGGGGGHGGSAKSYGLKYDVGIGGSGGSGGNGGTITVTNDGGATQFWTAGQHAHGMIMQSIGGGGGVGGAASTYSVGLMFATSVAVGGTGGTGGDGGAIYGGATSQGFGSSPIYTSLSTNGHDSIGISLQSIGGGGGMAGAATAQSLVFSLGTIDPELEEVPSFGLDFALGGSGGAAGKGGNIQYWHAGNLATYGDGSHAFFAQSVGGGGGSGGDATASSQQIGAADLSISLTFGLGGAAASGVDGGAVDLQVGMSSDPSTPAGSSPSTVLSTRGHDSVAIFAQSVGGGGGNAGTGSGFDLSVSYTDKEVPDNTLAEVGKGDTVGDLSDFDDLDTSGVETPAPPEPEPKRWYTSSVQCLKKVLSTGKFLSALGDCDEKDEAKPKEQDGSLDVNVGRKGGGGGAGGTVTVALYGNAITAGSGSHAIFAQSVGGGGGKAAAAGANSSIVNVNLGGAGGSGATGGKVSATNNGTIVTGQLYDLVNPTQTDVTKFIAPAVSGGDAHGIYAQSVGGGGGVGGNADPNSAAPTSAIIDLLNGKFNTAALKAFGASSDDINDLKAGKALLTWALVGDAPDKSASLTVNLGGTGGTGGNGGEVTVDNRGDITTYGHRSYGVFAQSVGGGGGAAGSANGSLIDLSATEELTGFSFDPAINIGGTGGVGGDGGAITISSDKAQADIVTRGYASFGMAAQSIGGGGGVSHEGSTFGLSNTIGVDGDVKVTGGVDFGNGLSSASYSAQARSASASGSATFGSQSNDAHGNSGAGGNINLGKSASYLLGSVTTHGDDAMAVFAQTIGGGGGLATLGCSNSSPVNSSHYASACWGNTTVEGSAGQSGQFSSIASGNGVDISVNGGNSSSASTATGAGTIAVYSSQTIETFGARSMGIVTQGITGGGGFFSAPDYRINKVTMPTQQRATNNSPGATTIALSGSTVTTHGDGAWGIFSQMVQGGGGFFGDSSKDLAFNVKYSQNANAAEDVFAPGGSAVIPTDFVQMRTADAGGWDVSACETGPSCAVSSVTAGKLYLIPYTDGQVQWAAGDYVRLTQSSDSTFPLELKQYDSTGSLKATIGTGRILNMSEDYFFFEGSDRDTGSVFGASDITVTSLTLSGQQSPTISQINSYLLDYYGAVVDSAGGLQQLVNSAYLPTSATKDTWTNQPTTVTLTNSSVETYGRNAHGIVIQNLGSVGGAWSSDGTMLNMGITLSGSNSGGNTPGGKVSLTLDASRVDVYGNNARGVVIQTDGAGPGGSADQGQVTVSLKNNSTIRAFNHTALMIVGGSYDSSKPSTISVGSGSWIDNDLHFKNPTSAIDNTDASYNKWAIYAPLGYTNLTNDGDINGNILLGISTRGDFTNNGTWEGSTAVVANNSLHNYGKIYVGGDGNVGTLYVDGSLKQYAGGEIHVDVNFDGQTVTNDFVTVNGLARIDGEIVPETASLLPILDGLQFLSATTLEVTGTIRDAHVFNWELTASGNTLTKSVTADFTPSGYSLSGNQGSMADYLQRLWDSSSSTHAALFGYVHEYDQGDHAGYQSMLNQVSGQVLNSQAIEMKTTFATSLSDSLSCPIVTEQGLKLNQTNCAWAKVTGTIAEQSSNLSNSGYHVTAGGIRLGAQRTLSEQWTTGFSVGYANNYLTSTGLTSNGSFFDASLSAQKKVDAWSFGASLGFAYGWFDNNRSVQLGANGAAAPMSSLYTSSTNMMMVGLKLRAAYEHEEQNHYIKPYVDLDLMYSHAPGFTEAGGALALTTKSNSQYNVAISPMVEFGTDVVTDGKRRIKAYVSGGASFLPNNNVSTQMAFANGLAGAGTYDVITDGPTVLGRLNLGIQAFESNDLEVRAQYGLQFGDGYLSQSLSANLIWRF